MSAGFNTSRSLALRYATLLSLALHALLLLGVSIEPEGESRDESSPPLVARLVEAPPELPSVKPEPVPPPKKKPPLPTKSPPLPKKPPPLAKKPPPQAKRSPITKPAPQSKAPALSSPTPKPAPPPPMAKAAPVPEERVASQESPAPQAAPALQAAPPPPPPRPEASLLAQYRLQLLKAAGKYKRYPRVAMDNNWEGEVVVRMVIGADGTIAALTVQTTSGHRVLDRQALEMFRRGKAVVPIPPALQGKEFAIEVRAIYNLRDQGSG